MLNTQAIDPELMARLQDAGSLFLQLFAELTLLFLVISFAVSVINQRLQAERIQALLGARHGRGYLTAAALGAVTPFCSCSTIPMLTGLLKARAGFGPTMTFLFTSPLLNPLIIALFIPVLGLQITLWYAGIALVATLLAGWLLQRLGFERFVRQEMLAPSGCSSCEEEESTCGAGKVTSQWRSAWNETWSLFRSMFPYMLLAMAIGALVHGFVPAEFFSRVAGADNPLAIPTAALIGIPLYIRVSTLLPLVGPLLAKGVSLGAMIALVVGSGGASLPEVILLPGGL